MQPCSATPGSSGLPFLRAQPGTLAVLGVRTCSVNWCGRGTGRLIRCQECGYEEHQRTRACIASHMDDSVNLGERIARLKVDLRARIKPLAYLWRTIHRCADHLGVATQDGISEGAGDDVRRLHSRMRVRWDDRAWLEG